MMELTFVNTISLRQTKRQERLQSSSSTSSTWTCPLTISFPTTSAKLSSSPSENESNKALKKTENIPVSPIICDDYYTRRSVLFGILSLCATVPFLRTSQAEAKVVIANPDAGSNVVRTASGLEYYDFVTESTSTSTSTSSVVKGDEVRIEYTLGTTGARNGWRIDSGALTFRVGSGAVVKGLEEGVVGMKPGGRRRLLVPAHLGYSRPNEEPIPKGFAEFQRFKNIYLNPDRPYKPDVVFDVTLLKIKTQ